MSTITNSTNRVAGLISGLETEELVKAMTANTKMRINSQKQKIQTLQWKQEAYRSIISKITSFQSKYLDILSSTSIKAKAVMNKHVATSSNTKAVTATASSNALPATYTIKKTTAATAASVTSKNGSVASGEVELDFSKAISGKSYTFEMELDGTKRKVTYTAGSSESVSKANFLDAVNEAFDGVIGEKQRFAFQPGTTSLYFNGNGDGITHTFSVGYNSQGLGLDFTRHNRISTSATLGEAGFATKLTGGKYNITINGVDFTFDDETSISSMMSTINNSDAGVNITFSNISQTFTIATKDTGASARLSVTQSSGNLLNAMFGLEKEIAEPKPADSTGLLWKDDITTTYTDGASKNLGKDLIEKLKSGFADGSSGKYKMKYIDEDGTEYDLELDLKSALDEIGFAKTGEDENGEPIYATEHSAEEITKAFNEAVKKAYKEAYRDAHPDAIGDEIPDVKVTFTYSDTDEDGKAIDPSLSFKADGVGVDFRTTNDASTELDGDIAAQMKNGFTAGGSDGKYKVTYKDANGKSYDLELDVKAALEALEEGPANEDGTYSASQISKAFNNAFAAAVKEYNENEPDEDAKIGDYEVRFTYSETTDDEGNTTSSLSVNLYNGGVEFEDSNLSGLNLYDDNMDFDLLNNVKRSIEVVDEDYIISDADKMSFTVSTINGDEYTIDIVRDGKNITIFRDGEAIYEGENDGEGISVKNLMDAGLISLGSDGSLTAIKDFTAIDEGSKAFLEKYFGKFIDPETGDYTIERAKSGELEVTYGTNSTITVSSDGGKTFATYTSADNSFTFDGTTITIAGDFEAESADDYVIVETAKDNSGIIDVVKGFIEDYNKLLEDLYGETSTSRPKSSGSYYDPLTEEQEEEMSDKEIEKWNENAKQGLLYQDNNIQKFLSELRSAMLTRVDGFGLQDLGIKLTESWSDHGKLEIDESKLEAAIESFGDRITNLFTGENGLASKLEAVFDKAVSTKTNKYGYLSSLAGIEGTKTDTDNQIYKQIEYINKILERLNTKYETEQERYWKKYSRLEQLMQQAQTQMSYFTDFGSNGGYGY